MEEDKTALKWGLYTVGSNVKAGYFWFDGKQRDIIRERVTYYYNVYGGVSQEVQFARRFDKETAERVMHHLNKRFYGENSAWSIFELPEEEDIEELLAIWDAQERR